MTHEEMIEVIQAHKNGSRIERKAVKFPAFDWHECNKTDNCFDFLEYNYRIKPEPKPEPKHVPLTRADFDWMPVVWLKNGNREILCTGIYDDGLLLVGVTPFVTLFNGWQYSTDRVNWKPCWKEV